MSTLNFLPVYVVFSYTFIMSIEKKVKHLSFSELEKDVANLNQEMSKAKQEEFEAQEELLDTRRELDEANQQIEQLKVTPLIYRI